MKIVHYTTEEELARCYPLMRALRGRLADEAQFIAQAQGYRLAGIEHQGQPAVLAGYRLLENFIHGSFCYVDDLVSDPALRGQGFGAALLDGLAVLAREYGCSRMVLDTVINNTRAQAFYQRCGYQALGLHFYRSIV
ncbi:hypothetical protein E05_21740 [Plautia stali symbiont]|nr:hypothetical protein E05_21740 [Plautia stali symbiont]